MSHRSISVPATIAVLAALAPAGANARLAQDLRSPDARDDAQPKVIVQDLRTPDSRDIATRPVRSIAPARVIASSPSGFDWGDAAIGAGGAAGIVLLLAGTGTAVLRRRGPRSATP